MLDENLVLDLLREQRTDAVVQPWPARTLCCDTDVQPETARPPRPTPPAREDDLPLRE